MAFKNTKNVERVVYKEEDYIYEEKVYNVRRYYLYLTDGVLIPIQVGKEYKNEIKGEED